MRPQFAPFTPGSWQRLIVEGQTTIEDVRQSMISRYDGHGESKVNLCFDNLVFDLGDSPVCWEWEGRWASLSPGWNTCRFQVRSLYCTVQVYVGIKSQRRTVFDCQSKGDFYNFLAPRLMNLWILRAENEGQHSGEFTDS